MSTSTGTGSSEKPLPQPYRRAKQTAKSVLIADKTADWTIRIGGISVIVAVFGIMFFLANVIYPLFTGGTSGARTSSPFANDGVGNASGRVVMTAVDEYLSIALTVDDRGDVTAFHAKTGAMIAAPDFDLGDQPATAFAQSLNGIDVAFGFADGTVRFGTLKFVTGLIEAADIPADATPITTSTDRTDGTAIYTVIPTGQVRRVTVEATLAEPQQVAPTGTPIRAMDYRVGGPAERPTRSFVTVDDAGIGRVSRAETRKNMMTGKERITVTTSELPPISPTSPIVGVLINDKADQIYVGEASGALHRYDARDFNAPITAEIADVAPGTSRLTAMRFLIGEQTLVIGRDDGTVAVYFRLARDGAKTGDGYEMTMTKTLDAQSQSIAAIASGQRGKTFATADTSGAVWLRHSTSAQLLLKMPIDQTTQPTATLAIAPRDNGVISIQGNQASLWDFSVPHPETTIETIFAPVWYEGYPEPTYTWQSSAGSDAFEAKLSLMPLIFGTLKATVYSLIFAVPIALGAAIFTAEFTRPRVRAIVKPVMELMASLPSVVLGFVVAIILAPVIENWMTAVVTAFMAVPVALVLSACVWQTASRKWQATFDGLPRVAMMSAVLIVAAALCVAFAPALERMLMAGDFKAWTAGLVGSDTPVMTLLMWPLAFAGLWLLSGRIFAGHIDPLMRSSIPGFAARAYLARWIATALAAGLLAWLFSVAATDMGGTVRGGVIDSFVQRNTLIVGFAMGFAVIPIIYTVSEDALTSVPEHLRAASLALGATQWQTTVQVVVPAAMSGIFAAVMVGMGRAVGETMIVVMAAGNTPIIDWNIFAGLRALSANIAVELPEAVRDSTLYRMLFLAAFVLFIMTFIVNTIAEVVRLRFRKRTASL